MIPSLLKLLAQIPLSTEAHSTDPEARVSELISKASWKAASVSGFLGLAPGPVGMITVLPDLYAIWKIQSQLVSDIAAVYGKESALKQESMLYCLFRHGTAHALNEVVMRVGERFLIKRASVSALKKLTERVGIRVAERAIGKGISRWIPVVGALAVGGYAKYDTQKVGETARELFSREIEVVDAD